MLKNIYKTHFFNFVANGFIRLCGGVMGWGGGGDGKTVPVDWGLVPEYFFVAGTVYQ